MPGSYGAIPADDQQHWKRVRWLLTMQVSDAEDSVSQPEHLRHYWTVASPHSLTKLHCSQITWRYNILSDCNRIEATDGNLGTREKVAVLISNVTCTLPIHIHIFRHICVHTRIPMGMAIKTADRYTNIHRVKWIKRCFEHNLCSRCHRHFVGITRYSLWS